MTEPRLNFVQCLDARALHRMAYWEWGDPANRRVLVCVHGLSRQGRDFDILARSLCAEYRVVCPDVADIVTLLARLDAEVVDWVGTSMGGLIGIGLAALAGSPVRALVLNDVGPVVEFAALQRIGTYLGAPAHWASLDEAADALWAISRSFGPHRRDQWLALTRPMLAPDGDGFKLHYDPAIAVPFRLVTPELAKAGEAALWQAYDRLGCRTLLLRGAESDVLSRQTANAMTARGPKAQLVEFAGVGHAPTLVQPDQVAVVRDFLLRG